MYSEGRRWQAKATQARTLERNRGAHAENDNEGRVGGSFLEGAERDNGCGGLSGEHCSDEVARGGVGSDDGDARGHGHGGVLRHPSPPTERRLAGQSTDPVRVLNGAGCRHNRSGLWKERVELAFDRLQDPKEARDSCGRATERDAPLSPCCWARTSSLSSGLSETAGDSSTVRSSVTLSRRIPWSWRSPISSSCRGRGAALDKSIA